MDDVLPFPTPDWETPAKCDAPRPEEVDAFAQLRRTAEGIRAWVATAYVTGVTPTDWAALAASLAATAQECAALGHVTIDDGGDSGSR
jgi:hypothetical protein